MLVLEASGSLVLYTGITRVRRDFCRELTLLLRCIIYPRSGVLKYAVYSPCILLFFIKKAKGSTLESLLTAWFGLCITSIMFNHQRFGCRWVTHSTERVGHSREIVAIVYRCKGTIHLYLLFTWIKIHFWIKVYLAKNHLNVQHVCFYLQVSKVFVPGLLSPAFSVQIHPPQLNTPLENVSTPARATVQHISRLEEVLFSLYLRQDNKILGSPNTNGLLFLFYGLINIYIKPQHYSICFSLTTNTSSWSKAGLII